MFARMYEAASEEVLTCVSPEGHSIYAMLYRPKEGSTGIPVVIAAPDGEERSWAQRTMVTTARALSSIGFTVLRFDYRGQGESPLTYESTTLETRLADLTQVWHALRDRTGQAPAILGVRLGGAFAIAAAPRIPLLQTMVLWEPVLAPPQFLQQLLRVNLSTQMVAHGKILKERRELVADARAGALVSVNGYNLSGDFIDDLESLDVAQTAAGWPGRGLIVATSPPDRRMAALPGWTVQQVSCPPFWKEPKLHSVAIPPFIAPTIEFLLPGTGRMLELSR